MVGEHIRRKIELALRRGYSYNDIRQYLCGYGIPREEVDATLLYLEGVHVTSFTTSGRTCYAARGVRLFPVALVGALLTLLLFLPGIVSYLR